MGKIMFRTWDRPTDMTEDEYILDKLKSLLLRGDKDLIIPLINRELMKNLSRFNCYPIISQSGFDINPVTRPECNLYGTTYCLGDPLNADELAIFKEQFTHLISSPASEELWLMLNRISAYIIALRAIKRELYGVKFAGINPMDTELGFVYIQPQFFRSNEGYRTNWLITRVANTPDTIQVWCSFMLGKDFGLIITHLKQICRGKQSIIPVPTILALPRRRLNAHVIFGTKRVSELAPGGLVIGLGHVLRQQTPTWAEMKNGEE